MTKIQSKFAEYLLAPVNAFPGGFDQQVETMDGVQCEGRVICAWNNTDGQLDDSLDNESLRRYGCPFPVIRSIWMGRLGKVDNYWWLIKLVKL